MRRVGQVRRTRIYCWISLFRKRVAYAFINARDAGSVEGFINIFERLGIGYVELVERQPDIDWDVIMVRVTDSQIADNTQLMIQIPDICRFTLIYPYLL